MAESNFCAWVVVSALTVASGCSAAPEPPDLRAEAWPEADVLFNSDRRWVGGDGAYSIDLGGERVLWLFGDSLIAREPYETEGSAFIRNSAAVQTGRDPTRALMQFYWGLDDDGGPRSYAREQGELWLWPMHGVRLGPHLLLFYELLGSPSQCDEPEWCFAEAGWTAFLVREPDKEPSAWQLEPVSLPAKDYGIELGEAVLVRDGWVYVYGTGGDFHPLYLARFPEDRALEGDLSEPEWWRGSSWGSGRPEKLLSINAPELSIHYDTQTSRYLMLLSAGFGASTVAVRAAKRPQGPWSEMRDVIRPEESFRRDVHVYAAKGHPELEGADLIATYVPGELYLPRFVRAWHR